MYGVPDVVGGLTNEQLSDMWNMTQRSLDKGRLDVALTHNAYEFMDTILREDKIEEAGVAIQGRIKLDSAGNAQFYDPFETMAPNQTNTTYPYAVPWKHMRNSSAVSRLQILENAGSAVKLYDFAKAKQLERLLDLADMVEESFWADAPAAPTTKALWGIKTWVGKFEGLTAYGGYYGCMPSGWTDLAGIITHASGTAGRNDVAGGHANWRNWCAGYKTINEAWLEAMLETRIRMKFRAPLLAAQLLEAPYDKYRIYSNVAGEMGAAKYQRKQGDDNSPELGKFAGGVTLRGTPIVGVDTLDSDTDDPFYFTNRGHFKAVVLVGDNLREEHPPMSAQQPDVMTTITNLTVNLLCRNRRQGVGVVNKF